MAYQLNTPPQEEPVSLADAKQHLRIRTGETSQDTLIEGLIEAVRQHAEVLCGRAFVTQTWDYVLDSFPAPVAMGVPFGQAFGFPPQAILLQKSPVTSITAITYTDMGGVTQTLAPSGYVADFTSEPARVTPPFGQIWPIPLPQIAAVKVRFVAGYGTASAVPQGIKRWMLLRLGAMFENREEVIVGSRIVVADMPFVDRLLDPYVVPLI